MHVICGSAMSDSSVIGHYRKFRDRSTYEHGEEGPGLHSAVTDELIQKSPGSRMEVEKHRLTTDNSDSFSSKFEV